MQGATAALSNLGRVVNAIANETKSSANQPTVAPPKTAVNSNVEQHVAKCVSRPSGQLFADTPVLAPPSGKPSVNAPTPKSPTPPPPAGSTSVQSGSSSKTPTQTGSSQSNSDSTSSTALSATKPQTSPRIWVATWTPPPVDCENMSHLIYLPGQFVPGSTNVRPNPVELALQSRRRPEGRAAIFWQRYSNSLFDFFSASQYNAPAPARPKPYSEFAINAVRDEWSRWLKDYKAAGGRLDYLIGDAERWGIYKNWELNQSQVDGIVNDPANKGKAVGPTSMASPFDGIATSEVRQFMTSPAYLSWNQAIGKLTAAAMNRAVWEPAVAVFPAVRGSNYDGKLMVEGPAPDYNGHPQTSDNVFGTAASPVAYGWIHQASTAWYIDAKNPTKLSKTGTERFSRSAWSSFVMDIQLGRSCRRNDPTRPLQPWIALQIWEGEPQGTVNYAKDMRYHDEMLRHYALLGTEVFLWWNTTSAFPAPLSGSTPLSREECARRFNAVVGEINTTTLGVVAKTTTMDAVPFSTDVVTTGARRVDGRWIWRTTARPGFNAVRNIDTGAVLTLTSGVGRWDLTETAEMPRYVGHKK
jgi:hypothetical protein